MKPEIRRPKAERRPKSEIRNQNGASGMGSILEPRMGADYADSGKSFSSPRPLCRPVPSDFGFRSSFGLRVSAFGFHATGRAFSLIEIMVTVGLLTFIILGLLLMFNQTQRAFRTGMTQTDVLEAGRATMDMLARELEQMTPSDFPDRLLVSGIRYRATNFFAEPSPIFDWKDPLIQELPGNSISRTNLIQRFFFLSKVNQDWLGTGYEVIPDDANGCVGALYRYGGMNYPRNGIITLSEQFLNAPVTNMNKIADGIVHLRVRSFAKNGYLVTTNLFTRTNATFPVKAAGPWTNISNTLAFNSVPARAADLHQAACYFMSNAVPGYVEVELGILEPQTLQKYRSIPIRAAARQYLSNHVAQVHIFRQRVPVRNIDLSAYP